MGISKIEITIKEIIVYLCFLIIELTVSELKNSQVTGSETIKDITEIINSFMTDSIRLIC